MELVSNKRPHVCWATCISCKHPQDDWIAKLLASLVSLLHLQWYSQDNIAHATAGIRMKLIMFDRKAKNIRGVNKKSNRKQQWTRAWDENIVPRSAIQRSTRG